MPSPIGDGTLDLLSFEAHAVGALLDLGISLMSTYKDLVQSAVVFLVTMIGALMNSAFNVVVFAAAGIVIHDNYLHKIVANRSLTCYSLLNSYKAIQIISFGAVQIVQHILCIVVRLNLHIDLFDITVFVDHKC